MWGPCRRKQSEKIVGKIFEYCEPRMILFVYLESPFRPELLYLPKSGELRESVQISVLTRCPGSSESSSVHERQLQLNFEARRTDEIGGFPRRFILPGELSVEVVNSWSGSSSTSASIPEHFSSEKILLSRIKSFLKSLLRYFWNTKQKKCLLRIWHDECNFFIWNL